MMRRTIIELAPNQVSVDEDRDFDVRFEREKIFMASNQISPAGVPCKYENGRVIPVGKLESVLIANRADVPIWAVFEDLTIDSKTRLLQEYRAREIPWADASAAFIAPYLPQCIGFSAPLAETEREAVASLLDDICSEWNTEGSPCRIIKWDDTNSFAMVRTEIGIASLKVFADIIRRLQQRFDVRSWQGEAIDEVLGNS